MKIKRNNSNNLVPDILCHPNIPQPLHGIAPREIMGRKWWDKTRKEVYASSNFHCRACGVHKRHARRYQWLEAHEFWHVDYQTGTCTITSIEPLCHFCHNFIHTGRLSAILGTDKPLEEVIAILEHGFAVLSKHNLQCFPFTLEFAKSLGARTFGVTAYEVKENPSIKWENWKLIWEGQEYFSNFKHQEDWSNHYEKD